MNNRSLSAVHNLLPQTQCRECGYPDCFSYAKALVEEKNINPALCAPGGTNTLQAITQILEIDAAPYLPAMESHYRPPATAVIREAECIGCTKCIQACPVDAIIGASKQMHSILSDECTGCGLCVSPCPVDCIDLIPLEKPQYEPAKARKRYEARQQREQASKAHEQNQLSQAKQYDIQAALARIKAGK